MRRIVCALGIVATLILSVASRGDPVPIPDPSLKAAIEAQLGISDPTEDDMLGLTALNATGKGIDDLTGLEYATNLISLDLYNNQISDISPLAGLMNLEEIVPLIVEG